MSRTIRMLAAAAPAVEAATPFTVGVGASPSVAVGGDGSGHVVWATTEDNSRVGYCRAAAGAGACNRTDALAFPGAAANSTGCPVVFARRRQGRDRRGLLETAARARTYRWISMNNGESFGAPAEIGRSVETHDTGLRLDDAGMFVGASSSRAKAADLTAGEGVQYATGGIFVYGPEVARVPASNKLVAATNDLASRCG